MKIKFVIYRGKNFLVSCTENEKAARDIAAHTIEIFKTPCRIVKVTTFNKFTIETETIDCLTP